MVSFLKIFTAARELTQSISEIEAPYLNLLGPR